MAMKYYSEQLNQLFDTPEELLAAEDKVNAAKRAEEEKKVQLKAQREQRAKEVEDAFKVAYDDTKRAYELLSAFVKDYGAYHTSIKDVPVSMLDALFNLL